MKKYIAPAIIVVHTNSFSPLLADSNKVTGDIAGEVHIGYGGGAENDPNSGQSGDAKENDLWEDDWGNVWGE